jgi:hypothetical protein
VLIATFIVLRPRVAARSPKRPRGVRRSTGDLACRPRADAQRIAHRYRWHAVWLPRCCLHGNSPPLLQPIFLLLACCTQEDAKAVGRLAPPKHEIAKRRKVS